jgi:uncharacterized phage protein gp47/JayE
MPTNRPNLQQLLEENQQDIESRLAGANPRLRRNLLFQIAKLNAAGEHNMNGRIEWMARQLFPETAETEFLEIHAARRGLSRIQPTTASGNITLTGTNDVIIPAGQELQTSDGTLYEVAADGTIVAGTVTVEVTAVDSGSDSNQDAGVTMTLSVPIAGVNSVATVAVGGITGGADEEDDERLRSRVMAVWKAPAQGGADHDYEAWAKQAHVDVTNVWVYPNGMGPGTVVVYIMTYDATEDGIPTAGVIADVQEYIEARMPVEADLFVAGPDPVPLDFDIQLSPDTAATRTAVEAALRDFVRRAAAPVDTSPEVPTGTTVFISQINETISVATGEVDHVLSDPPADVDYDIGEIPVMGDITWI